MIKHFVLAAAIALQGGSWAVAQTAQPSDAHKSYDQKRRDCRKQADEKGLKGEEMRAFIAQCMKA